jgi:hypothetical protein
LTHFPRSKFLFSPRPGPAAVPLDVPPPPAAVPEAARPAAPDRLAAAGIEPALTLDDWARALSCSRRGVERLKSSGKLPRPDFHAGRCPRWHAATVRAWLARGGRA